jgi:WD40 repeat protein
MSNLSVYACTCSTLNIYVNLFCTVNEIWLTPLSFTAKTTVVKWDDECPPTEHDEGLRLRLCHTNPVSQVTWHGRGDYFATLMPAGQSLSVMIHQLSKRKSQVKFQMTFKTISNNTLYQTSVMTYIGISFLWIPQVLEDQCHITSQPNSQSVLNPSQSNFKQEKNHNSDFLVGPAVGVKFVLLKITCSWKSWPVFCSSESLLEVYFLRRFVMSRIGEKRNCVISTVCSVLGW